MDKVSFNIGAIYCIDCVVAIRKFVGTMDGIEGVDADEGKMTVSFDPALIQKGEVIRIMIDAGEKVGYKITEE